MALTLGEKLRQAREARGFTLSEVAEQTRIASLYLESIENDEYRPLPGGIFNKGFVKSFAKFVGVNEQEALADYTSQIAETEIAKADDAKPYRPEVLTDDRSHTSMMPTMIVAAIILALMTIGILYGLSYWNSSDDASVAGNSSRGNTNAVAESPVPIDAGPASNVPQMDGLKVEFKAISAAVSLSATRDGTLTTDTIAAGSSAVFEPKESLKLGYSRSLASVVQMTINGKPITLPSEPLIPKRSVIEFEINRDNLNQIWTDGKISTTPPTVQTQARPSPAPRPSAPAANRPTTSTPPPRPASTPRPANTP